MSVFCTRTTFHMHIYIYIDIIHAYVTVADLMTQIFCFDRKFYAYWIRAGGLCVLAYWGNSGALRMI